MALRTLAALLALLAATACTGGGDGLATPEATAPPTAAMMANPTPTAEPTAAVTPDASPTPEATATSTPPVTPTASPTPEATATAEPMPRTAFGDGEWRVGVDIAPGRYRAWARDACQWSTGSGRTRRISYNEGTIAVLALSDRTFLSRGCSEWTEHPKPRVPAGQPFGDGDYLVGVDIAPGRYRTTTASARCYWKIGALTETKNFLAPSLGTIVDIRAPDYIFSTHGCGTWTTDLVPRIAPGEPFGNGTWLVGSEIAPGRYRTASDSCRWRVWSSEGFRPETGLAWTVFEEDVVDIDPTDVGFSSRGCKWTTDLTPRIAPGEPFGDGTWLVGSEVAPGLYVAERAHPVWEKCEWERRRDFRRGVARFFEISSSASLAAIVEINPDDAGFHSRNCGVWRPYPGPAIAPGEPFGDGVFLVGAEIAPGSWRAASPTGKCEWERLREDGGSRPYGNGGYVWQVAHIAPTDLGFASRGCGTWEPVPIASFGDGEHRVGVDIPPGLYRASAPTEECAWERRDADGVTGFGDSSIPIAAAALSREPGTAPRDPVFASSGCGTWTNELARIAPGQPFGDGAWLVGFEVAPGRYRAIDPSDSCRWQRLGWFYDLYDRGWRESLKWGGAAPNLVGGHRTSVADIVERDAAFLSRGCGTWTRELQPIAEPGEPFGDGTYIVGIDIAPGRYRAYAASAPEGSLTYCRWEFLWDFEAYTGYTYGRWPLASGGGSGDMAALTLDITESVTGFHSEDCGMWTSELTPIAVPGEPFGDGEWIVGLDIAPGRYRTHSPSSFCSWTRLSGFSQRSFTPEEGVWYDIEVIGGSDGSDDPGEVTIAPSDAGFYSRACGTWTPVPP